MAIRKHLKPSYIQSGEEYRVDLCIEIVEAGAGWHVDFIEVMAGDAVVTQNDVDQAVMVYDDNSASWFLVFSFVHGQGFGVSYEGATFGDFGLMAANGFTDATWSLVLPINRPRKKKTGTDLLAGQSPKIKEKSLASEGNKLAPSKSFSIHHPNSHNFGKSIKKVYSYVKKNADASYALDVKKMRADGWVIDSLLDFFTQFYAVCVIRWNFKGSHSINDKKTIQFLFIKDGEDELWKLKGSTDSSHIKLQTWNVGFNENDEDGGHSFRLIDFGVRYGVECWIPDIFSGVRFSHNLPPTYLKKIQKRNLNKGLNGDWPDEIDGSRDAERDFGVVELYEHP